MASELDAVRLILQVVNAGGVVVLLLLAFRLVNRGDWVRGEELRQCRRERDSLLRRLLECRAGKPESRLDGEIELDERSY